MPDAQEHEEIRGYLLGTLSQGVQQRLEERLLTEDSFYEELLLAEEELIDDYVNDVLNDDARLQFEQHFLATPERRQKLRFALAFNRYTATSSEKADSQSEQADSTVSTELPVKQGRAERFQAFWSSRTWALRAAAALGVVAVVAGAVWFTLLRTSSPQTFATITLVIGANNRAEGAQPAKVSFPLKEDALRISLTLPERLPQASGYRVELLNNDRETETLKIDGQDARFVTVVIPSSQLARGQYALRLYMTKPDGTEERVSGSYLFNVE